MFAPASGTLTVALAPAHREAGAVNSEDGVGLTETLVVAEAPQPDAEFTFTEIPIGPVAPAVKVIEGDPAPAVMVPFVMVQA